ncbi:S-layer homology domain-containing protein [Thermophilibacter mediterraneus]|uniref:S-layer homology domain-containing protein n=1 Tax=Thermophilibacter mediterraneus TaxID=1871031 RepID=UPI000A7F4002|nr:S-layer homology domain-containing protein [Thermophilibacter mediterraneus]
MTRRETRRTRRVGWLAALLGAFVLALSVMPVTAWADEIEVGEGGSLHDVVMEDAKTGDTIKLTSDITLTEYVFVDAKDITIDGGGYTITRGEDFTPWTDGRGGYNPAMIEVANGAELKLVNITLDDDMISAAERFVEQGTEEGEKDNESKVQDAIIAAYAAAKGGNGSTIVLGNNVTLKNFGGMSAVRVGGQGKDAQVTSKLIMESGSKIIDDPDTRRAGGVAAVWSQGGMVEVKAGAKISGIDGRAIYLEDGGYASVAGEISDITANNVMMPYPDREGVELGGGKTGAFSGIAVAAMGNSTIVLTGSQQDDGSYTGGSIKSICTDTPGNAADSAIWLTGGSTFSMTRGSMMSDIERIGLVDNNEGHISVNGVVTNCHTDNVPFRLRGSVNWFSLGQFGVIKDCSTTDASLIYMNGGKPTIELAGTIDDFNTTALFVSPNGSREDGSVRLTKTGVITNVGGHAILAGDPSKVTVEGTITDCAGYAVLYAAKNEGSLLTIDDSATISGNHGGGAQVSITRGEDGQGKLVTFATDAARHAEIAPGAIEGNTTIDLPPFDVTLDEDYASVKLGSASDKAVEKIREYVVGEDSRWEVVGSDAVWLEPSGDSVHFVASGLSPAPKNTGLYVAFVELAEDGSVATGVDPVLQPVENSDQIDVTLTGLKADTAYAVMFVNNAEYTLAPDDVTVYTGGGQGDEKYDDGGFPALTIADSVDPIESLVIDGGEPLAGDKAMQELLGRLTVTYYDGNTPIENDSVAGEHRAVLSWKYGQKPGDITINGNEVSDELDEGKLVVRYVEDVDEAQDGASTHGLLTSEPVKAVEHAEAIAKKGGASGAGEPEFYTNGDEGRAADPDGVQLLDDGLLADEDGTDRQALLEKRAEETVLQDPGEGQAWRYEFRYLDLVDAHNGNAWVSASYGTTVYLPYPDGVTKDNAEDLGVKVVHFPGLHREYGFSGRDEVEGAIAECAPEAVDDLQFTDAGIRFDVDRSGFSPFAVAWRTAARTITATADGGSTVTPSGTFTVPVDEGMTFAVAARAGYAIEDVTLDGASVLDQVSNGRVTVPASDADQALRVTSRSTSGGGSVTPSERYTITASAGEGGSISPSGTHSYAAGSDVTFTIAPDEGWTVGDVTVDGVSYRQVGSYTFEDLDDDHTISVTFMRGSDPASPDETGVSDWLNALDHVAYLHGYGDGSFTFGPENPMTRAEVAQMFYNLLLDKGMGDRAVSFEDVPDGAYYAEPVRVLASRGILNGTSPETFEPDRAITRAEFVAIAMRFSDGEFEGENPYVDVPEDAWYRDYVVGATSFGWIYGYQDGSHRFGPDDTITRGQATMVTNRMLWRSCDTAWAMGHMDQIKTFVDLPQGHYAFFDVVEATNAHDYERVGGTRFEGWTGLRE